MTGDKDYTDPNELADAIERRLQPGNDLAVLWFEPMMSKGEWDIILMCLRHIAPYDGQEVE